MGFFASIRNSVQRGGTRRGGRIGKFFSAWNARTDRKQFRRTGTMGF